MVACLPECLSLIMLSQMDKTWTVPTRNVMGEAAPGQGGSSKDRSNHKLCLWKILYFLSLKIRKVEKILTSGLFKMPDQNNKTKQRILTLKTYRMNQNLKMICYSN